MLLDGLAIADDRATWESLGFAVTGGTLAVGGVGIRLAGRGAGDGILGWHVDGLRTGVLPAIAPVAAPARAHPNGVLAVDHVVAVCGDLDTTMTALRGDGLAPRRVREVPDGARRQAFYALGTALLELVGPVAGEGPARFWGLTLVAADLDALGRDLGARLGPIRAAVQPGRRIATLRADAGSRVPLAFMSPR